MAKIGVDVELIPMDLTALYQRLDRRAFDLAFLSFQDTTGDPEETLQTYYATGSSRN